MEKKHTQFLASLIFYWENLGLFIHKKIETLIRFFKVYTFQYRLLEFRI